MKIRLSIFLFFLSLYGYAQVVIPPIVSVPILEKEAVVQTSSFNSMNAALAALKTSEEQVRTVMKTATWARDLSSVRKLVGLIENTICLTQNLNARLNAFGGNCLYQFRFDIELINIGFAADQIGLVISNGVEMTTGDRLAAIDRAVAKYHQAQIGLSNLNGLLQYELDKKAQQQRVSSNVDYLMGLRTTAR
mgnify:CR=1 FL=1